MAKHIELRPEETALPLMLASEAMRKAETRATTLSGTIAVDNGDGTQTWIGGASGNAGVIPWVGDTTPPGRPTGISATGSLQIVTVRWDGNLEGGIPDDFDHVEIWAKSDGLKETVDLGMLRGAGELATGSLPVGEVVEVWGVAYDDAHDEQGRSTPNASEESEHATVVVEPIVSVDDLNETADEILASAKSDTASQISRVDQQLKDTAATIEANKTQTDKDIAQAREGIEANRASASSLRADLEKAKSDILANGEKAALAKATADGKNMIYRGPSEPAHDGLTPGDMWWRTQTYWTRWDGTANASPSRLADFYTVWEGEPNASPSRLVTLDERVVEVLTWDGKRFTRFNLVATDIVATGTIAAEHLKAASVTGEKITADALYGKTIQGGTIRTTDGRLIINDTGMLLKDADGTATLTMLTADGSITMKGRLTSGSQVSGATVTGGTIQTSPKPGRGVKITSGGLIAYGDDGNAKFTLTDAGEIKMDGALLSNGTITAARLEGGTITGGAITGTVIQSSDQEKTGLRISGNTLQMWDSGHNRTVFLDGEGKSNILTGTFQTRVSGHRMILTPDYATHIIGGDETFTGDGITFAAYKDDGTPYRQPPTIASVIQSSAVGPMSELDLWGGNIDTGDPGAFGRLRSRPRTKDATGYGMTSSVYFTANTNYDQTDTTRSAATLEMNGIGGSGAETILKAESTNGSLSHAAMCAEGPHAKAEVFAEDSNGSVGMIADINNGFLHLGGYLGSITGRGTFATGAAWKAWYPASGQKIAVGASTQVHYSVTPAKYGRYYAVANADSAWAGIIAHVAYTGTQSGWDIKLFNADVQPCPSEIWCECIGWLVK